MVQDLQWIKQVTEKISHIQCIEKQTQINFLILEAAIAKRIQIKAFNSQVALQIFTITGNENYLKYS
jgi:hypothetical protein